MFQEQKQILYPAKKRGLQDDRVGRGGCRETQIESHWLGWGMSRKPKPDPGPRKKRGVQDDTVGRGACRETPIESHWLGWGMSRKLNADPGPRKKRGVRCDTVGRTGRGYGMTWRCRARRCQTGPRRLRAHNAGAGNPLAYGIGSGKEMIGLRPN